ncbi:DNA topoisomerase (ATP-hydrolyzing) subunit B [Halanaeroarchaeum sulfurireducens]|uniref:DNA topoisomerase (ATP-hydrolyzing) n=1 Tax=Halanaeroarchaeum sulfurireducens TaxID=1604004 RepID=A0A0N9MXJ6_9EURY|nr:DNA topoisomerase (ATP-hydrolyzing) subunit B [Halanaeroarchaeum sulfurireducens]ALG82371.1 DNA gyrase subunit B [Halanaeroarchaeum sulfurireducens]
MEEDSEYGAGQIQVLEGLEAVRKRPAMYVGSTDARGPHHLVYEVVDNSIDEALAGYCSSIEVVLHDDGSVSVTDDGRGIPVDTHEEYDRPAVEVIMTVLHAGGKFDNKSYQVSGGLHGVGVSVVNALSERLAVEIERDGGKYQERFEYGEPVTDLETVEDVREDRTGTTIRFRPDSDIFETDEFDYTTLSTRLRELAFLNSGVEITLRDERDGDEQAEAVTFEYEGGIREFVEYLNDSRSPLHEDVIYIDEETDGVQVEIALQATRDLQSSTHAFANNINTREGGTHLTGFKTALTRIVNDYANEHDMLGELDGENLKGEDIREGLTAVISIKHPDPQFEGQTKTKLGNSEVRGIVESTIHEGLGTFFEENPDTARAIISKAIEAAKARKAAKEAEKLTRRKNALESTTLPGKLADCQTRTPEDAELFIVEGDSAGGCFVGDTEIALASGESMTLEELVEGYEAGETHYAYTIKQDGSIGLEEIRHPRMTKEDASLVEVTLDNGESIQCTPDHEFMLRDGTYTEAGNLEAGDSLMPLYRKSSDTSEPNITIDGYEMVKQPNRTNFWKFTHLLADRYNLARERYHEDDGDHNHHVDFDKRNNRPDNIERLSKEDHLELHRTHAKETLHTEEVYEKFFEDEAALVDAVSAYNHTVVSVEHLDETADVYDIEIPGTHNFALESGVFVHNSAKQARDREFQAVLPIRGKILNVEKHRLDRILQNEEIRAMIRAIGTGVGEEFDIENLRYNKIIAATDADVDGAHIRTLLLTFFYRHMRPLLENGHVYAIKPPLYRIRYRGETYDAMTDEERDRIVEEVCDGNPSQVQRFKGLGEMNPEQLWDTAMNPENRILKQMTIEDAAEADRMFSVLMGEAVEPRKRFIQDHATDAEWVDI